MTKFEVRSSKLKDISQTMKMHTGDLTRLSVQLSEISCQMVGTSTAFEKILENVRELSKEISSTGEQISSTSEKLLEISETYDKTEQSIVGFSTNTEQKTSSKTQKKKLSNKEKEALDKRRSKIFWESLFELGCDLLTPLIIISKMPLDLINKGPIAFINDGWKLINSVFTTGYDLVALAGLGMSYFGSDGSFWQTECLKMAEENKEKEGLADVLHDNRNGTGDVTDTIYKGLEDAVSMVDVASDTYSIVNDVKDLCDTADDILTGKFDEISYLYGEFGFKSNGTISNEVIEKISREYAETMMGKSNFLSNTKQVLDYVKAYGEDEFIQEVGKATTIGDIVDKISGIHEETEEWMRSNQHGGGGFR